MISVIVGFSASPLMCKAFAVCCPEDCRQDSALVRLEPPVSRGHHARESAIRHVGIALPTVEDDSPLGSCADAWMTTPESCHPRATLVRSSRATNIVSGVRPMRSADCRTSPLKADSSEGNVKPGGAGMARQRHRIDAGSVGLNPAPQSQSAGGSVDD